MRYSSSDWRRAVSSLLKKTSQESISWNQSSLFEGDAWTEVDGSFESTFNTKYYVVSQIRRRHYLDEDEYVWTSAYDLSVFSVDFEPKRLASAPEDLSIIGQLFAAAEDSFAFNIGALDGLLEEE